VTQENQSRI